MKFRFPGETFQFPFDPKIIGSGTVKLKGREKIIQIEGGKVNAATRNTEGLNVEDKRNIFIFDEIAFLPDFALRKFFFQVPRQIIIWNSILKIFLYKCNIQLSPKLDSDIHLKN